MLNAFGVIKYSLRQNYNDHCYFLLDFWHRILSSCGHLLGKDWPLGSRLLCLTVSLSLSHWYPGSGVILDVSIPDLLSLFILT